MTRVKICGLTRPEDVECAIEEGADALGFVFEPTSKRYIGDNPEFIKYLESLGPYGPHLVAVYGRCGVAAPSVFGGVQAISFEVPVSQRRILVVRPEPEFSFEGLRTAIVDCRVSALLVDSYRSNEYGGTGERVSIDFALSVKHATPLPVVLAGGLDPDNVASAIDLVRPYAVDVSSGVEVAPGMKDRQKIRAFIQAVKHAE